MTLIVRRTKVNNRPGTQLLAGQEIAVSSFVRFLGRFGLLQFQRRRIDAVTQAGRLRAIGKHVAEVTAAAVADRLGAVHPEAIV